MWSWRRWRWLSETHLCPRSLPRFLGLGAREGRRLHRASPASSASLHLQRHQVTSSRVLLSVGSAHRAAPFPGRGGPSPRHVSILFMLLTYLVGGAPRAASSPSCSGLALRRLLFPRLLKMNLLFRAQLSPVAYRGLLRFHAKRLHVKSGVPKHRDSWAPTSSPALTPWP